MDGPGAVTTDHIRYDLLAQDALRGVVRRVLSDAARDGLPGEHHFYISFKTRHPAVKLSSRLAEKYPDEITIVLQHQFWDLTVGEHGFEVGLSFGNHPEKLVVAYEAVTGFFDPSVQFGLKFEVITPEMEAAEAQAAAALPAAIEVVKETPPPEKSAAKPSVKARDAAKAEPQLKVVAPAEAEEPKPGEGKKVVSLDTFRKKK